VVHLAVREGHSNRAPSVLVGASTLEVSHAQTKASSLQRGLTRPDRVLVDSASPPYNSRAGTYRRCDTLYETGPSPRYFPLSEWIRVASLSELEPGSGREFVVGERIVALFRTDEKIYALDGICPHQGGPLGDGRLEGNVVTCPWHGWQFDVRNGQHQFNPSFRQPTLPVRIEGDAVYVDVTGDSAEADQ